MKVFVFVGRNRPDDEWNGILSKLGVEFHKFRDPDNTWYQQEYWKNTITDAVKEHGSPDLSFGSSMGGWAALYFQPIVQAKRVIAFSPQSSIIPNEMLLMGGKKNIKWANNLKEMGYSGMRLPQSDGRSILYYGTHKKKTVNLGDVGHQRLAEGLGYTCINIDTDDHNIAGVLNEQGKLIDILRNALNEITTDTKTI